MTETDIPYSLASYLSYEKLSEGYKSYICAITLHPEPSSFTQAKKFDAWLQAMNEELLALESTHTWDIMPSAENGFIKLNSTQMEHWNVIKHVWWQKATHNRKE